ncbi:hypothetical protein WN55_09884 [Dufourea novaeangliae]|uniref:Uncharacterized protein n=1 Tax=Dufourea novaeangliae TaxID=178035 RepID=A0A154P7J0_DUFNO|nr:hypothetical protein WN55_09884 [Dufourea novaeangliae]
MGEGEDPNDPVSGKCNVAEAPGSTLTHELANKRGGPVSRSEDASPKFRGCFQAICECVARPCMGGKGRERATIPLATETKRDDDDNMENGDTRTTSRDMDQQRAQSTDLFTYFTAPLKQAIHGEVYLEAWAHVNNDAKVTTSDAEVTTSDAKIQIQEARPRVIDFQSLRTAGISDVLSPTEQYQDNANAGGMETLKINDSTTADV